MLERPNDIAICFIGGDSQRTEEQINALSGIENIFNVEWSKRSDKLEGYYPSYSQAVNEAVIETESEFMILINPQANPEIEDIELIISELCNGYAYSSVVSFGLWGITKEVFRRIGMFDERFLGGEYEDNDFLIRMQQLDVAISWRWNLDRYKHWIFGSADMPTLKSQHRGLTKTLYPMKWHQVGSSLYRTDLFPTEKQPPKWFLENKRHDIYRSWKPWTESKREDNGFVGDIFEEVMSKIVKDEILTSEKRNIQATLEITSDDSSINFKSTCDIPTELQVIVTDQNTKQLTQYVSVASNTWRSMQLNAAWYDLRIQHNGRILAHDNFFKPGESRTYQFGLDIYNFLH